MGHKDKERAGAHLLWRQAERAGVVYSGEERAPGRPSSNLSVPKGGNKRAGDGLFRRTRHDSVPFLEVFKDRINGTLRNLISLEVSLSLTFKVSSNTNHSIEQLKNFKELRN